MIKIVSNWFFLLVFFVVVPNALAATVSSTFDSGNDGWFVYDDFDNSSDYNITHNGVAQNISYTNSHGENRWWLVSGDKYSENNVDWPQYYGGTISFDLKIEGDSDFTYPISGIGLDIEGPQGSVLLAAFVMNTKEWHTYTLALTDAVFCYPGENTDDDLTLTELVNSDSLFITGLTIGGGWLKETETVYLDNVILKTAPVPVPGTLIMLGSGLLGIAGFRRRKTET